MWFNTWSFQFSKEVQRGRGIQEPYHDRNKLYQKESFPPVFCAEPTHIRVSLKIYLVIKSFSDGHYIIPLADRFLY